MPYRCLVIGAGSAGAFRDEGSHGRAYAEHPACQLLGFFDINTRQARKAAQQYQCRFFKSLTEALGGNPDIVSVTVHQNDRKQIFKKICAAASVKVIYCEKPLAESAQEALNIVRLCRNNGKRLYVNYQRRANTTYQQLARDLKGKKYGSVQNVIMTYTRGMWTNASHFVDLSLMLFGRPQWVMAQRSPVPSPYQGDPNATILLGYKDFHVHLVPLLSWDKGYYTGDLDLRFGRGRLFIPSVLHYKSKDVKQWIVKEKVLQAIKPRLTLSRPKNDFLKMLKSIIEDLKRGRRETLDPQEAVWSVRVLELAQQSMQINARVNC